MAYSQICRAVILVGLSLALVGCSGGDSGAGGKPVSQASPSVQTEATPGQKNPDGSGTQASSASRNGNDSDDVGYTKREDGTAVSGAGYVTQANLQAKAESGVAREFSNGPSEDLVKRLREKSNKKRERAPVQSDMNAPMYDSEMVQVR